MNARDTLSTFLIIGAQKGGTRWLRTHLGAHPEVFAADTKLSFFGSEANVPSTLVGS